jgi:hypothetical protein
MDPLLLGAIVAAVTIFILFSGISVANGLLVVSALEIDLNCRKNIMRHKKVPSFYALYFSSITAVRL